MIGKQAKILSEEQVERLLEFVSTTRNPVRNPSIGPVVPQSWVAGWGNRQTDLADGVGSSGRNCRCH